MTPEQRFLTVADELFPLLDNVTRSLSHYETMELEDAVMDGVRAMAFQGNLTDLVIVLAPYPTLMLELAWIISVSDIGVAA